MSALSKGFRILEVVTADRGGLSFSDVVERTEIPKASAHRLLRELVDLAALEFDEATRTYRGGLLLAGLGASVTANYDVRRVVRPHLEALHLQTGSVVTVGIRDGDVGIYIDKIEPTDFGIRLHSEVGKRFPLHCTAMGKVLLAHSDTRTIGRIARRKLPGYTANTITDGPALRKELDVVADKGHAVDREEITRGLVCVAAPVFGVDGEIAAAISSTISSFDASPERIHELAAMVMRGAADASGQN
ncbi:MAG: IclR family transcriptional regulator [Woeseiaceae bacterium]|nr:IclR family transcriptional regulator [Gammaproteobacteria bacterium]NNF49801.1 IclR family transcriptional regulator [Woeseiaceae bacterium]NNK24816.1 IclR family transcriptional regulator [Woeseiaceae bacterium]NNL63507.1 IclR family transcriptional regulator [Woeseiaceae bacterium]